MINSIGSITYTNQIQTSKINGKQELFTQLKEKYSCLRNGYCKVSASYIKKCENDPQERLELEKTLSFLEQNQKNELKWADARGVRIDSSWTEIDADGNCTGAISTTRCSDKKFVNSFNTETGARSATSYTVGIDKSDSLSDKLITLNKKYLKDLEKMKLERKIEQRREESRRLDLRQEQIRMQQNFLNSNIFKI